MRVLLTNYHCRSKTTHYRPGYFGRELAKRGHAVTVLCTSDHARTGVTRCREDGVSYVEVPDLLWGKLRTGWDLWNLVNRCRELDAERFDLIHCFETRPATIHPVLRALRRAPAPLVIDWIDWWGRGGLIREHRPWWYRVLFAWFETYYEEHFRIRADATTVISRALGERAAGLGVDPASVFEIPNGAPVTEVKPVDRLAARVRWGIPADAFVVADAARDVMLGVDTVLAAVRAAWERVPGIRMVMTGADAVRLKGMARRHGLDDVFLHLGEVPFDRLPDALSCADVFLMGYPDCIANRGRWPGRLGLFLALGRPVLSSPVGEVGRWLGDGTCGLLVPHTIGALSDAIALLAMDADRRETMGRAARAMAERLSWERMTDRLECGYAEAERRFRAKRRGNHVPN